MFIGCDGAQDGIRPSAGRGNRELLSVDFRQDKVLRYRFISSRQIEVDFGPTRSKSESVIQVINEKMQLVFAYKPFEVDSYGLASVQATCESAQVERTSFSPHKGRQRDAVEALKGRSFKLQVSPSGMLTDKSQLRQLIGELGEEAFDKGKRRIKNPDMIFDFIATQWFLWDSTSSIERPSEGVAVGDSWDSRLLTPLPMPMPAERKVVYRLDEVRPAGGGQTGRVAVIKSSYSAADSLSGDWPMPYGGRFRMRGMFGFFQGYKILGLSGEGTELFNIDAGVIEQADQQYVVEIDAVIPFGLGDSQDQQPKPNITIKQQITMQLLNKKILSPDPD
jgi:hypothetical protein